MEIEAKVTSLHLIAGIAAAYISFILSTGSLSGIGKNDALAVLAALIILYITGQISERIFGKEEVGGIKGWLWSGIVPFFFVWIMVWTIFLNM
ncbi:MAG: hypothetical protein FJ150_02550 [Euryarchaeota archaeon]|nr:hypothetical protein [Euryarchaeota archaeon]